ncbi:uroporphyrinogen decarboxylase family protein [Desulfosporosinus metallidurans]|uniref:Methylcobalamin:coenzyme M methyltransferase, methanol-specific n=1 Tax=Desulfosporosinus metallidurans TaxID=1888891 RepID=A0A1Q8QXL4_9FIRM|nr:uroporphyrinogen decarboxylase family protein [Desulfosporosinus metallidurans]OLN32041.1 Methylcobalamin:coenzyme M methyltransferase, methanol-specific [Desulfosporosinus metallidurans]
MDFICTGDDLEQIPEEVIKKTGISFPGAHSDKNSMATLAGELRKHRGDVLTRVPFCVTVEAEAYGAHIKLGNALAGPRVESYRFASLEEMSNLQGLDLTRGRIKEVLDAVEILVEAGEKVALSVEGPFTILSSLIDPMNFYKGLRKNPQRFQEILAVVEESIIRYSLEGVNRGASIISYGDPVGAMGIIGPKVYREYSGPSSWRIIKGIKEAGGKVLLHLCGKTSTALEKIEMARSYPIETDGASIYGQALLWQLDKATDTIVIGHRCIKGSLNRMVNSILCGIELIK